MYWPPRWTPNNVVTLTDGRWLVNHPATPRFGSFTQSATVLSPWLSWAGIDTRWAANDPMLRVLLAGEPDGRLYSVMADGVGSIVTLGSIGAGLQRWEVVGFFDYYADDNTDKAGAYAWCRLWDGVSGGGSEPEDPLEPGDAADISGGGSCDAGTAISLGTLYSFNSTVEGEWYFTLSDVQPAGPQDYTITFSGYPDGDAQMLIFPEVCNDDVVFQSAFEGLYTFSLDGSFVGQNLQLNVQHAIGESAFTVLFRIDLA